MRHERFLDGWKLAFTIIALAVMTTSLWAAAQEQVLHSFGKSATDGQDPVGGLIFDSSGNLYGTSRYGGLYGDGSVFELRPRVGGGWSEEVLHSFDGNSHDGFGPYANLIMDAKGNLYGTTCFGGAYEGGTVFELIHQNSGGWTEDILHSFGQGKDGICSYAGLVSDPFGNLYGTTYEGGDKGAGTIFELTPAAGAWTEKVLHSFNDSGDEGNYPENGLVLDRYGNLYGSSNQAVFELTLASGGGWEEKVLYLFGRGYDGYDPEALIFGTDGNLYGTTYVGGAYGDGTVFELQPGTGGLWTEKLLHSFDGDDGVFVTLA